MNAAKSIQQSLKKIPGGFTTLTDEKTHITQEIDVATFLLMSHTVTGKQYLSISKGIDSESNKPMVAVSWYDTIHFCNRLSELESLTPCYQLSEVTQVIYNTSANGYRLPTEAEWEYACRAGSPSPSYGNIDDIAWYVQNSEGKRHEVGLKQPNAWGLYDMLGNVWEWCWDIFDCEIYGEYRVFRGGGWSDPANACRASCRRKSHPTFHIDDLGFRLAKNV